MDRGEEVKLKVASFCLSLGLWVQLFVHMYSKQTVLKTILSAGVWGQYCSEGSSASLPGDDGCRSCP